MGIRQSVNENPAISATATGLIIVAAIVFIWWQMSGAQKQPAGGPANVYYSDDDGKTYFVDTADKVTPFTDANGKEAVQAMVFQCSNGTQFVGYLMRYTAEGKKTSSSADPKTAAMQNARMGIMIMEVKKPGARSWVKFDSKNPKLYNDVLLPTCPDGSTTNIKPIFPAK